MPQGIKPLGDYLREVAATERGQNTAASRAMTRGDKAKVRAHARAILDHYEGVRPERSFIDAGGTVFDAIPIEQQPSLRGQPPPPAPPGAPGWEDDAAAAAPAVRQLAEQWQDAAGNALFAPPGTVPVRRPDPEDAVRRIRKRGPPRPVAPSELQSAEPSGVVGPLFTAGSEYHYHAYCELGIPGRGGFGIHTVYKNGMHQGQAHNLSQQWHGAGGAGSGALQVFEPMWMVQSAVTGHDEPALIFFTTKNNYAAGSTAWNVEPGSPFVQTNNLWALTGALAPLSVVGGQQYVLGIAAFLVDGKWWMYAGGKAPANAIGYVPVSWYDNGPLTTKSEFTQFGGEVAGYTNNDGVRRFGGMGSGRRVGTGNWQQVAYIRHMQYFDTFGFANVIQQSNGGLPNTFFTHAGYSAAAQRYAADWNSTFFYGGPGGTAS